jgi:hypothetical protein
MFRDNVKARVLGPDGAYTRRIVAPGDQPFRVQDYLQQDAQRRAALARESGGVTFVPEDAGPRR